MSRIDFTWLQSDFGKKILQSVQLNGKLKHFGISLACLQFISILSFD